MATEVSVLDKDGDVNYYSTYAAARADIISSNRIHPLVQIWADLDEQIILLDGVDIWIAPGVTISYSTGDTITDDNVAANCNIFGYGYLTQTSTDSYAVCNFTDPNSKISVKCDTIENESAGQACVSSSAKKFHLECNLVYGKSHGGVYLNNNNSDDININAEKIITGQIGVPNTGTTALFTKGFGFIHINEILCRNLGHCLTHRAGEITAIVRKSTSIMNTNAPISTVHLHQGVGDQKLIMYFDEISNFKGSGITNSLVGIEIHQGTGIFIGRKVIAENGAAALIGPGIHSPITPYNINLICNELVSINTEALTLNGSLESNFIKANIICGNKSGDGGVVFSYADLSNTTSVIKNAKLINKSSDTSAKGIGLFEMGSNKPHFTLWNLKIVSNNQSIFFNGSSIDIKNYGLFVKTSLNESIIHLKIGTGLIIPADYNYQYIVNSILT
ncbi:MAG: hypothetical protein WAT71_04200 [Ignavibacteria bacterium]